MAQNPNPEKNLSLMTLMKSLSLTEILNSQPQHCSWLRSTDVFFAAHINNFMFLFVPSQNAN